MSKTAKDPAAVALGRRGGASRSPAKMAAVLENLRKARKGRWPKRKKSAA